MNGFSNGCIFGAGSFRFRRLSTEGMVSLRRSDLPDELSCGPRQSDTSGLDPSMICKGLFGDGDSRTGYRPRAQGRVELCCEIRRSEREAQPQPWETEEFPKGPQDNDIAAMYFASQARPWRSDLHERFVDGEKAASAAQIV